MPEAADLGTNGAKKGAGWVGRALLTCPAIRYHVSTHPEASSSLFTLFTFSFCMFWVWLAALLLAIWAARIAQRFGRRLYRYIHRPIEIEGDAYPRVVVIVPIKGLDDDTHANIQALLSQDYPEYRLIFTLESDEDPAVNLLEKMATEDSRIEIVIAGLATSRGQKIHNQLAAAERTNEHDDVFAFMDADARPGNQW